MDNIYKKLAKRGWNHDKKVSNRDIRNYNQPEDENYSFVDAHLKLQGTPPTSVDYSEPEVVSKSETIRTKLPKSIEKEITKHIRNVTDAIKLANSHSIFPTELCNLSLLGGGSWSSRYYMGTYFDYIEALKELPKYLERKDLPNKLSRRINEALLG